ncbi:MAG: Uma2 family endonuclease [Mariprofundales bacterium]|nr:Uma2 family endonuclease [Mariprofundales bacterium]
MSYEEFLEWCDEDTLAEWVDGEVVMTSPASRKHQMVVVFLTNLLSAFVELRGLGVVLSAPFQMKLRNGREPDLMYVAREHVGRLKETYLDGPADLAVEVVSPESGGRDRGDKFYEYAEGGVREYWLIDPQARWGEFYHLLEGHYRPAFSGREGVYRSAVLPGFWLRVEWLWQEPMPSADEVLFEIGGDDYVRRQLEIGGEEYVRRLIKVGGEAYARLLIEQLRKHGWLPVDEGRS